MLDLEYKSDYSIDVLCDAPYLICVNKNIDPCYSKRMYLSSNGQEISEHKVLSMLPDAPNKKALNRTEKLVISLTERLNNNKNKGLSGYDVAFNYNLNGDYFGRPIIYPVTNNACGGISKGSMQFILDYCKNKMLDPYFTYTNIHSEKERYGTYTPCVSFH